MTGFLFCFLFFATDYGLPTTDYLLDINRQVARLNKGLVLVEHAELVAAALVLQYVFGLHPGFAWVHIRINGFNRFLVFLSGPDIDDQLTGF